MSGQKLLFIKNLIEAVTDISKEFGGMTKEKIEELGEIARAEFEVTEDHKAAYAKAMDVIALAPKLEQKAAEDIIAANTAKLKVDKQIEKFDADKAEFNDRVLDFNNKVRAHESTVKDFEQERADALSDIATRIDLLERRENTVAERESAIINREEVVTAKEEKFATFAQEIKPA